MKFAESQQQPFYLNLWPDDVHSPFWPPVDKWADGKRGLYLSVLQEMDREHDLGELPALRVAPAQLGAVCSASGDVGRGSDHARPPGPLRLPAGPGEAGPDRPGAGAGCATDASARLTFAAGLRSILRHDPDVVLIGEIRDGETAQMAAQAEALTGKQGARVVAVSKLDGSKLSTTKIPSPPVLYP